MQWKKVIRRLVRLHPSVRKPGKAPFFMKRFTQKINKNKDLSLEFVTKWLIIIPSNLKGVMECFT